MKSSTPNFIRAAGLVLLGLTLGAAGIYVGDTDDAPGAALLGILLMIGIIALAVRIVRRKAQSHRQARILTRRREAKLTFRADRFASSRESSVS